MNIDEKTKRRIASMVLEIVGDHLGVQAVILDKANGITMDLGADSLDKLELVMTVEELFTTKLNDNVVASIETIDDIITAIVNTNPKIEDIENAINSWRTLLESRM